MDLVWLCENCDFLCRVASHEAFLGALGLLERVASDGGAGLFFHFQLISIAEVCHSSVKLTLRQEQLVRVLIQHKHDSEDRQFTKVNLPSWPRTSSPLSFRNSVLQLSVWVYIDNVAAWMKQGKLLKIGLSKGSDTKKRKKNPWKGSHSKKIWSLPKYY